jgi:two-component system, NtrC family, sensor histidine kinase HydH
LVSNYLIGQILDREWQATAKIVRADVRTFLEEYDFKAKDRKSVGHKFRSLLDHMRLTPDILQFRVYNAKGVVIWSDDRSLVGKSFSDKPQLRRALQGQVVADMSRIGDGALERSAKAVEVYVPIHTEDGQGLLGVFETYRRPDSILNAVREARLIVLAGALGGGLLLYGSLFAIVRRAALQIDEQQKNLLKMQSELVASQRMAAVGEMAAAVAHGIGNPLSAIRAAAQVALLESDAHKETGADDKMKVNLQSIMRQVDRVQRRMQGLLNFAKPLEPHPIQFEINVLLRDVTETLRPRFQNAEVLADLKLEENLPKVFSDGNHLEQVFMGLITNALEATPKGGQVTVRTSTGGERNDGKRVRVTIEDTGEGIPAENRERVFEPFFTTKPHGTGIGLPLAKRFLERNGGTIKICDAVPSGARIEVTLPASA